MAKFCGRCGSPLNSQGLCPNCAPKAAQSPAVTPAAPAAAAQTVKPEKKKNKLKIIIPVIAGSLVVIGALVFCAIFFKWFGGTSEEKPSKDVVTSQLQAVSKTSYGTMWGRYNLDLVTSEEQLLENTMLGEERVDPRMAQDGDTFYGVVSDKVDAWRKVTVTGKTSATTDIWVSEQQLDDSILCFKAGDSKIHVRDMGIFFADGDWVYSYVAGSLEWRTSHQELNYRIVRASKDGKTIEFVGDETVRACECVVYNGWIYYVDNGYVYDGKAMSTDESRVGIYKMKCDGSGKTCIYSEFKPTVGYDYGYYGNAGNLTLYNGKLYFDDFSDGSSSLARINLDGSGYERLTVNIPCDSFAIDPENDMLYFVEGKCHNASQNAAKLYKLDLGSRELNILGGWVLSYSANPIAVVDGYLYTYRMTSSEVRRLDISANKAYFAEIKYEQTFKQDPVTKRRYMAAADPTIKWIELDESSKL